MVLSSKLSCEVVTLIFDGSINENIENQDIKK